MNNLRTTSEFHQEFPLMNRLKSLTVARASDGALVSQSDTLWQRCSVPGVSLVWPEVTMQKGERFAAENVVNKGNPATRAYIQRLGALLSSMK